MAEYTATDPTFYAEPPRKYDSQIDVADRATGRYVGTAERTGCTAPGYEYLCCYRIRIGFERYGGGDGAYAPGYFVWDGANFIETEEWYANNAPLPPPEATKRKTRRRANVVE